MSPINVFNENNAREATDLIDAFPDIGDAFPTYTADDQQRDRDALISSRSFPPAERAQVGSGDTLSMKMDPNSRRVEQKPQIGFQSSELEVSEQERRPKADYSKLNEVDFGSSSEAQEFKRAIIDQNKREVEGHSAQFARMTQNEPQYETYDNVYIETVQGPFSELPYASTYTKYFMRQYRPDPRINTNISVTLSVNVAQEGTSHFSCPQPAASTRLGSTFSFLGGPSGPGCQNWSATGNMIMDNDLTSATRTLSRATAAYGNPYVVT